MWRPISTAYTEGFITDYYTSIYVFYIKFCKDNFTIFVLSRICQSIVSKTIDRSIVPMTIDRWRHQWRSIPLHCNENYRVYSKGKYPNNACVLKFFLFFYFTVFWIIKQLFNVISGNSHFIFPSMSLNNCILLR